MKLQELFDAVLRDRYLGKTIKSGSGVQFVVSRITVEHGAFGDPPLEIRLESKDGAEWIDLNYLDDNLP